MRELRQDFPERFACTKHLLAEERRNMQAQEFPAAQQALMPQLRQAGLVRVVQFELCLARCELTDGLALLLFLDGVVRGGVAGRVGCGGS